MTTRSPDETAFDLIGRLYDAAQDERLWPELALNVARGFGGNSCALHIRSAALADATVLSATPNMTPGLMREYEEHFWQHDLWVAGATQRKLGTVLTGSEMIPDAEFLRTAFFSDWCRRMEVQHLLGAALPVDPGTVGIIGIHRPPGGSGFDEAERSLLTRLMPHLRRAFQLRQRLTGLTAGQQAAQAGLAQLGGATLVVAADGRILHASPLAEAMLDQDNGLDARHGKLVARDKAANRRLAALIAGAAATAAEGSGAAGGALALPRPGRLALSVLVAPFRPAREGLGAPVPAAVLFLRDPELATPSQTVLRDLFGLTPAEAAIAADLAAGHDAEIAAVRAGVSLHTVRSHIRSLMAKTGTHRQGELVALILRSAGGRPG